MWWSVFALLGGENYGCNSDRMRYTDFPVIKMIFVCDRCHYLFSRTAEPEQCPDCGKYAVRMADEEERREYAERLKEFQRGSDG